MDPNLSSSSVILLFSGAFLAQIANQQTKKKEVKVSGEAIGIFRERESILSGDPVIPTQRLSLPTLPSRLHLNQPCHSIASHYGTGNFIQNLKKIHQKFQFKNTPVKLVIYLVAIHFGGVMFKRFFGRSKGGVGQPRNRTPNSEDGAAGAAEFEAEEETPMIANGLAAIEDSSPPARPRVTNMNINSNHS